MQSQSFASRLLIQCLIRTRPLWGQKGPKCRRRCAHCHTILYNKIHMKIYPLRSILWAPKQSDPNQNFVGNSPWALKTFQNSCTTTTILKNQQLNVTIKFASTVVAHLFKPQLSECLNKLSIIYGMSAIFSMQYCTDIASTPCGCKCTCTHAPALH